MPDSPLPPFVHNRGLFDDAYLAEVLGPGLPGLPGEPVDRYTAQQAHSSLQEIMALWLLMRARMSHDEEVVRDFVRGVYRIYGVLASGQRRIGPPDAAHPQPDLVIFADTAAAARSAGMARSEVTARYHEAFTVVKAERLNSLLDAGPITALLEYTGLPWGLLTDGGRWRLYRHGRAAETARYLEVDLEQILDLAGNARADGFRWFFAFTRPPAFRLPGRAAFLDVAGAAGLPRPAEPLSFADAAEQVLAASTTQEPMHYRAITESALAQGLLVTHGRTPASTMYSQILREIVQRHARGTAPRFTKRGPGLVGLARWER